MSVKKTDLLNKRAGLEISFLLDWSFICRFTPGTVDVGRT